MLSKVIYNNREDLIQLPLALEKINKNTLQFQTGHKNNFLI
jgi:hypothetical protein